MTAKGYFQFIDGTADLWDWVAALPYKTAFTFINCGLEPVFTLGFTFFLLWVSKLKDETKIKNMRVVAFIFLFFYLFVVVNSFVIILPLSFPLIVFTDPKYDPEFVKEGFHTDGVGGIFGYLERSAAGWDTWLHLPEKTTFAVFHYLLEPLLIMVPLVFLLYACRPSKTALLSEGERLAKVLFCTYGALVASYLLPGLLLA